MPFSKHQRHPGCQSASNFDPQSALKIAPLMETCSDAGFAPAELAGVAQPGRTRISEAQWRSSVRRGS